MSWRGAEEHCGVHGEVSIFIISACLFGFLYKRDELDCGHRIGCASLRGYIGVSIEVYFCCAGRATPQWHRFCSTSVVCGSVKVESVLDLCVTRASG
jgi:hypothetical protein